MKQSKDTKSNKEIKPGNLKGNQPWIFIGRTNAKAEAPILWPPDTKSWLIGKDPDAGKDWGQEEKWAREDETIEWHHRCNVHELRQTLGDGEGQGGLACCSPWGCKESDATWQLNSSRSLLSSAVSAGSCALLVAAESPAFYIAGIQMITFSDLLPCVQVEVGGILWLVFIVSTVDFFF